MRTVKLFLFVSVLFILQSCAKKSDKKFDSDYTLYKDYITGFSSGLISAKSDIQVSLPFSKKEWQVNQELDKNIFSISPSIDGKVLLLPDNIIAFRPSKKLEQDKEYNITLKLSKITDVPQELSDFKFTVKTLKQDFLTQIHHLQSYNKEWQFVSGSIKTSDFIDAASVKKLLSAKQGNKQLPVRIEGNNEATLFNFIIDSINRKPQDDKIEISWSGKPIGIENQGNTTFEIPGRNTFKVISIKPSPQDSQVLHINFSDPLKKDQDLSGLVAVENVNNLRYSTDGNLLKVSFEEPLNGKFFVEVFQGIENTEGFKMKSSYSKTIEFEQLKPEVKFVKNGTILPSSNNLKINFQAVNLSSVDVKVFRIFENNVMQFLQTNELDGNYDLRRVALPIASQKINLTTNKLPNYSKWNTYALDLSSMIKPEQGAIYRVELSIKKGYSLYNCGTTAAPENNEEEAENMTESQDGFEDYYDYYDYDYDWRERDNPCHKSYYYNRRASTNVLASDLGVIAKRGENNSYFFAVNDIITTQPVPGATIDIYNFQQQKLTSADTDTKGIATLTLDKPAFFAIVKKDNNTTYIKLQDGSSQSVSNFDVDGTKLQKGLKGYIYGERGVWRPGDTLFLSFILNDKAAKLPETHPIKLRLSDPHGKLIYQTVSRYNETNHYKFIIPTNSNSPTGNWEAIVSVGGAKFYKSIKIETIKPNRLKIKNNLEGKVISAFTENKSDVQVSWLHGAVARNMKLEMQAKFFKQKTIFKGYQNFVFDDPVKEFSSEEINLFSGKTDENGNARVTIRPQLQSQAPGMLKASFVTKAYETGGDFSTDVVSATYSPFESYVGLKLPEPNKYGMLETGANNRFEVVNLNESGKPLVNRSIEVKIYRIEWRWWWDASNGNVSGYNSALAKTPYYSQTLVTDSKGKASFNFKVDDDNWGRYLVRITDMQSKHSSGETVLIDWPYWSGKTKNTGGEEAAMLVFTTNKEKYSVGEKITVSFPSSEGSRALLSVENGSKVIQTLWAETKKGETQVEIPVTSAMAPNVYIHISLLQPHASTKNDAPIRLYGIVPVEVADKQTILEPVITMPDVLRPEQKTTIKVSEKTGRAMTYTIAIVDDGLLDLTRFATPNAWNSFFSKEALGVKTWDIYNDVIGAYGGRVNQVFSIGGDEDLGGGQAKKANRFKPVVIYLGPYSINKNETKQHHIQLPQYIGSVRTMVVASNSKENAYGSTEKTTQVKSPLMLLASMPRKVSPKEKITLPVTVFAMENHVKTVNIEVKTNKGLKTTGSTIQTLSFNQPDEKVAYFELEAADLIGIGKVTVTATSGKNRTSYDVELDVINPNPITQDFKTLVLEPGKSGTLNWESFGVSGSNKAVLEVASFPPIDFNRRLDYLIRYPHGCLEQVTSGVFPQLYLADVADINSDRKSKIQKNITAGIQKLSQYQMNNGGFAYWPGATNPDDWSSSYVGHFFIEAEKKGYVLPANSKKQWIAYQQKASKQWRYNAAYRNDFAQSYRLYTLALAGAADLSSMNRLRETAGISNESKLRLAAAYAIAGQKNAGLALLNQSVIDEENSSNNYYYYGSGDRNRAMALETLILLGQKTKAFEMANTIAKQMSSDKWMSTQTTAFCLYSMSKFAQNNNSKGIDIQYTSIGKTEQIKTVKAFAERNLQVTNNNSVTMKNNNKSVLYVKVIYSGILPVGEEQVAERGLSTAIAFKDRNGKVINPESIIQGTEFVAEVTVRNTKGEHVENVALTQIIPSGWEIVNTRFTDYGEFADNKVDYTDIRDDRTNFYFALRSGETKTFRILLNASYLGHYYLPGLQCEAMYNNSFLSRTKGQWVKVVRQ